MQTRRSNTVLKANVLNIDEAIPMTQIMIVYDSPTDAHVLKKMLEKNGFETVTAVDASEGIEGAKR